MSASARVSKELARERARARARAERSALTADPRAPVPRGVLGFKNETNKNVIERFMNTFL